MARCSPRSQAILQYLADQKPEAQLAPPAGTMLHYRLLEWLGFISSELHKNFGPLLTPGAVEAAKAPARDKLGKRLHYVANHLASRQYLVGEHFTVADAYLYNVLTWTRIVGIDLSAWPVLAAYRERVQQRPAVQAARRAEGLTSDSPGRWQLARLGQPVPLRPTSLPATRRCSTSCARAAAWRAAAAGGTSRSARRLSGAGSSGRRRILQRAAPVPAPGTGADHLAGPERGCRCHRVPAGSLGPG